GGFGLAGRGWACVNGVKQQKDQHGEGQAAHGRYSVWRDVKPVEPPGGPRSRGRPRKRGLRESPGDSSGKACFIVPTWGCDFLLFAWPPDSYHADETGTCPRFGPGLRKPPKLRPPSPATAGAKTGNFATPTRIAAPVFRVVQGHAVSQA